MCIIKYKKPICKGNILQGPKPKASLKEQFVFKKKLRKTLIEQKSYVRQILEPPDVTTK